MTADKQLKAYIDRVLRLKEEQDALGDDIREIYAEAKGEGYDKTIMGKVVAHLRRELKKGSGAVDEAEMVFDTYLTAYRRASGTPVATHTHAPEDHDPVTGEILDVDANAKLVATVATGMQTEIGRKALIAAVDIMIEQEEANEVPAQDGGGTGLGESLSGKSNAALPASVDAHVNDGRLAGEVSAEVVTVVGTESGTVSHSPSDDDAIAAVNGKAGLANVIDVEPSSSAQIDPNEDRSEGQSLGGGMNSAGANKGGDHVTAHPDAATHQAGASFKAPPAKSLRPNCLRPDNCAGFGSNHCYSCGKAAKADEVAA